MRKLSDINTGISGLWEILSHIKRGLFDVWQEKSNIEPDISSILGDMYIIDPAIYELYDAILLAENGHPGNVTSFIIVSPKFEEDCFMFFLMLIRNFTVLKFK